MRDIKFRGWDGKQMHQDITQWYISDIDKKPRLVDGYKLETLMQYTGLKDKNGVEIYEGDVVFMKLKEEHKWHRGYWEYPTGNLIITGDYFMEEKCVIGFQAGCFGLISQDVFHAFDNFNDWETEITGNLYQNPELLTPPLQS